MAKLFPDQAKSARSFVSFVEEQVERLQDSVQPLGQFFSEWNRERNSRLADFLLCAGEFLGYGRLTGQKSLAYLGCAEPAEYFKSERDLGLARNNRVTTHEHHSQTVILDFVCEGGSSIGDGIVLFQ